MFWTAATKSLNVRKGEKWECGLHLPKKGRKKKRQERNRLYPRVTLIPPRWGRIMAAVMAVQHFSSSFLLDFHPAGTPHGVHMMEAISKDNTQTRHPSWAPAGLWKRQSKEVMFCVSVGGWREERHWRKSNKCICGNRNHLSLVFALLKGKNKKKRLTVVINEIRAREQ